MRWAALVVVIAGCAEDPGVDARPSEIVAPTVIAVAVEPAEAAPGTSVAVTVTVATPDGPGEVDDARWDLCVAPRPATENNAVPTACVTGDDDALAPIVGAPMLSADACARFGPNPPPGGFRPRDPDPTGGYYQPIRVAAADQVAFGMARLHCGLANAPLELVQAYAQDYRDNVAPVITALELGDAVAGADVNVAVRWPRDTQESYLRYAPDRDALDVATERLTVSWFVTGGSVALDRSEGSPLGAATTWTLPDQPGVVHVWAVARDDRGGVAVIDREVEVR